MRQVIGFHFSLTDQSGNLLEDTKQQNGLPMIILLGAGGVLPALERGIQDMDIGARKRVTIPVEEAYGPIDPSLRLKIPRLKFPKEVELSLGLQFQGGEKDGWPIIYRITEIEGDDIYADANHELAGLTLQYDVEITEKREATAEEISHGHAHRRSGSCG